MNNYMLDQKRFDEERKRWLEDPFTSGVVVRHKASGIQMVVVGKPSSYVSYKLDRTCAWVADNRRHQDDFSLCELERVDAVAQHAAASEEPCSEAVDPKTGEAI